MFDLTALPDHYLAIHGIAKVAEVTGKSTSIISMWTKRKKFPLEAVAKLLEFDPAPLAAIRPLYTNPEPGKKLAILMPLMGPPEPKTMDCLMKMFDPREMAYQRIAFNCLSVARNALAAFGLRGGYEWFFWPDGDSLLPCGDAAWYKEAAGLPQMPDAFAGIHTIYRLLHHRKTIVSVAYVSRRAPAVPQFGGDPQANRLEMRRGPQNRIIERPWVGFGGVLTHRSVFEDIIKTQGDEIHLQPDSPITKRWNYEYAFFHPLSPEIPGDDIPWSTRAGRAGHRCHVDLAVQAAHIGDRAYTFADVA